MARVHAKPDMRLWVPALLPSLAQAKPQGSNNPGMRVHLIAWDDMIPFFH